MKTLRNFKLKKLSLLIALSFAGFNVVAQETVLSKTKKFQWGITLQSEIKKTEIFEGPYDNSKEPLLRDAGIHLGAAGRLKLNNRISLIGGLTVGYRKWTNSFFYYPHEFGYGTSYGCVIETPEINSAIEQLELRLPIAAQFYVLPNKLSINVGGSFIQSLNTKYAEYYFSYSGEKRIVAQNVRNELFSNRYFGINAGVAYQFKLENKCSIQIEPNLNLYSGIGGSYYYGALWGLNTSLWFR